MASAKSPSSATIAPAPLSARWRSGRPVAGGERGGHELAAFDQAPAPDPVAPDGGAQNERDRGLAVGHGERDRRPDVVAVGVHAVQPRADRRALEPALAVLEDLAEVARVRAPRLVEPAAGLEQVVRVLAHGLEHDEAAVAAREQAVLDERGDAEPPTKTPSRSNRRRSGSSSRS